MTAKRSERKRQWGAKALAIVLFMAAGAVGGYLIGHAMSSGEGDPLGTVAWLVAAVALLVVACILQVVVHEAGHLVLGLATGYRFRSFRVGSLMLVEQDGRLCLKRLSIQGTGGQCLMGPPDLVDGRIPYRLYNLGGVLANTLVSLVAAALAFALPQRLAAIFFAFLALVGFVFALTNGLPLTVGGVNNDGKNLRSAGESPDALRAFWTILKVGEAQADDLRVMDMPAAWFAVPADSGQLR
ncbi:MAG: M50 family metallopeptidase, partial [Gordonibacter urolithinfaciens]